MTVRFGSGRSITYYERNGMVMQADSPDATRGMPAKTRKSLRELYDTAVRKGYPVDLMSAKRAAAANDEYDASREANRRTVAQAEVAGSPQSRRISRRSGRITTKRRGR